MTGSLLIWQESPVWRLRKLVRSIRTHPRPETSTNRIQVTSALTASLALFNRFVEIQLKIGRTKRGVVILN
jgi:hypothetical protein